MGEQQIGKAPPQPRGGELPQELGESNRRASIDSSHLLDHNDSTYHQIFGQKQEQQQPQEKYQPSTPQVDERINLDYLKITKTAETLQDLAKARLDTNDPEKAHKAADQMMDILGPLDQTERNAVWISMLTKSQMGDKSGAPVPGLISNMEGKITGFQFTDEGSNQGTKYMQIEDGPNGTIEERIAKGHGAETEYQKPASDNQASGKSQHQDKLDHETINMDYLKVTQIAEQLETLAKSRLDTTDPDKAEKYAKQSTEIWGSLDQTNRNAVWVSLLTRSQSDPFDTRPDATLMRDMDGKITGLNFEAGKGDYNPGPKYLQIVDSEHGTVTEKAKSGDWFSKHHFVTDYVHALPYEAPKEVGSNKAPEQPRYLIMKSIANYNDQ